MTSSPQFVRVASVQVSSDLGEVDKNIEKIIPLVEEAASNGTKFIVLPETAVTGYLSQDLKENWCIEGRDNAFPKGKHPKGYAEYGGGQSPSVARFQELSKRLAVYITVPFLEVEEEAGAATQQKYYNSITLVGPEGEIAAHYRKTSPWPHPEKSWACAGTDVEQSFADTPYGRVGLAICFDIHSVLAKYARHKLWTLLYPIAWVGDPHKWFRLELPKLLKECNCPHHIIGCNWSTDVAPTTWEGVGISTHYGPKGDILASTGEETGSTIVYSTIPTHDQMLKEQGGEEKLGALNLDVYGEWTALQRGGKFKYK